MKKIRDFDIITKECIELNNDYVPVMLDKNENIVIWDYENIDYLVGFTHKKNIKYKEEDVKMSIESFIKEFKNKINGLK